MNNKDKLTSDKGFVSLLVCQFCSSFSDSFLRTLFILILTFNLKGAETIGAIMISVTMVLFMIPFIFVSPNTSDLPGFFNKIKFIRKLQFVQLVIAAISAYGLFHQSYDFLLVSIFLYGIYTVLFSEARNSIAYKILNRSPTVSDEQKIRSIALFGFILGMVTAGKIIESHLNNILLQTLVLWAVPIVSLISSYMIPLSNEATKSPKKLLNIPSIPNPLASWKKITKNSNTRHSLQGIAWFWLLGAVFISQLPALTRDSLHCDASVFVFLLSIFFLGMGLGTYTTNKFLKKQIGMHLVPTAMLIISICSFDIWTLIIHNKFTGYLKNLGYFLSYRNGINLTLDFFILSFAGGIYLIPLYRYLRLSSHRPYRRQMRNANNVMNALFVATGSIISIVLLTLNIAAPSIMLLLAVSNLITAIYICKILPNTVIKNIFRIIFKIIFRFEAIGLENLRNTNKRTLMISNHISFLDPLLISAFIPGKIYFAVGEDLLRAWWLKPFMKILRAHTINYNHPMAAKTLIDKLKAGKQVVIFPEGRISITGSLMKIYDGPAMIAEKAKASLLPIKIEGSQFSLFSKTGSRFKSKIFPKIKMTISPSCNISLAQDELSSGRERRHIIGDKLYDIMSSMMFTTSEVKETLFEALLDARSQFGGKHKIFSDVNKVDLTYDKLVTGSFAIGAQIAKNSSLNERIAMLLPNVSGLVVTFFASLAYGRTPTLLNFSTGTKNLISCCKSATIKTVYTSKTFLETAGLESLEIALKKENIKVVYIENLRKQITSIDKVVALFKSVFASCFYSKSVKQNGIGVDSPAVVLFTSGSEGAPKGVVLSNKNILSNLKQVSSRVDITSSDRLFNALPMFHSFGLTAGTIMPLLSGVFTFLYPSPLHYRIVPEMIYASNATIFFGTDTFLAGYAKYAHPYDFFSVRYVFAGAEALRNETRNLWMNKFGIRVFEGYGATEASPIISINTPLHCKNGTTGRILPGIDWKIEKIPGIEEGGRLIVKGPNIMAGYLKVDKPGVLQPPTYEIDNKSQKGWYDTGDVVSIDEDLFITIKGRVKRFAKIAGEMVSLAAIEDAINQLWPEYHSAAIAVEDKKKGEAIVVFTTYPNASREEIASTFHQEGYAEIFAPKKIKIIEEIPVLGTGKTNYVALQELASDL